jgi:hypothetical protein
VIVIAANTIRFGFDIYYIVRKVLNSDYFYHPNCPDRDEPDSVSAKIEHIAVLVAICLFTFYLPVFIVLRIYNLEDKP